MEQTFWPYFINNIILQYNAIFDNAINWQYFY